MYTKRLPYQYFLNLLFHFLLVSSLLYLPFLQINLKLQSISFHGSKQEKHFEYFSISFYLLEKREFRLKKKKTQYNMKKINNKKRGEWK